MIILKGVGNPFRLMVLGSLLLLCACAANPRPDRTRSKVAAEQRHEIYLSLVEREHRIQSLRGVATIHHGLSFSRRQDGIVILVNRPLNFRITHLPEFGLLQQEIASFGGSLTVFWPTANKFYQGIGTEEELTRYLSLSLSTEDAVRYLLTVVPLDEEEEYVAESYQGIIHLKGLRGEIWAKPGEGGYLPVRVIRYSLTGGKQESVVQYGGYQEANPVWFPTWMKGEIEGSRIELKFDELELNPKLAPARFEITLPKNATRIYE